MPSRASPAIRTWATGLLANSPKHANKMSLTTFLRIVVLLSVLVLLGSAAAATGHHHEDDDVQHDCALCTAGSLTPFVGAQFDPSPCLAAAPSLSPNPQGPPLGALYRAHLLSRAPPVPA